MKIEVERILRLKDEDGETLVEVEILEGGVSLYTKVTANLTLDQLDSLIAAIKEESV